MAEKLWLGTKEGSEGDWQEADNWSPSGAPGASDVAHLRGPLAPAVKKGLASAATVQALVVDPQFAQDLGKPDQPLEITVSDYIYVAGKGNHYIDISGGAGPTNGIKVQCATNFKGLFLKCGTGASDVDLIAVYRGLLELQEGDVASLLMELIENLSTDAAVIIGESAGTIANLRQVGGVSEQKGGTVTTHKLHAGTATWRDGTLTNGEQYGGTAVWSTNQTLADYKQFGGSFDATQDARTKAITAYEMHGEAQANLDNLSITLPASGIRVRGKHMPQLPAGALVEDTSTVPI